MKNTLSSIVFLSIILTFAFVSFSQNSNTAPVVDSKKTSGTNAVKSETTEPATKILAAQQKRRIDSFQIVWQTINDNYFDQKFNGLDWNKVRFEFLPRVTSAQTDKQLNYILQEMINRLNRSHFSIIPPEVASEVAKVKKRAKLTNTNLNESDKSKNESDNGDGGDLNDENETEFEGKFGLGIEIQLIDNRFVVSNVEDNSAGQKAGLKTGYIIEKVNDVSLTEFLTRTRAFGALSKSYEKFITLQIGAWFFNGEKDSTVSVGFLDENDQSKELVIKRDKLVGEEVTILKNLPKQFFKFESRSLSDDIYYVKFNMFALNAVDRFCQSVTNFKTKKALIIDLRGNIGGSVAVMMGISGFLTNRNISLGTQIFKVGREAIRIDPHIKQFRGKVLILVNESSYSAAEIFAAAMQDNNLATIIGEKTAGEALPAVTKVLPTGAIFLYPIANFETPRGNMVEGKGVEPTVLLSLDRKSLLNGKDVQLDAAIKLAQRDLSNADIKTKNVLGNGQDLSDAQPPTPKSNPKPAEKPAVTGYSVANPSLPKIGQDPKALAVVDNFTRAIGGLDTIARLKSYSAKGKVEITRAGATVPAEFETFRKSPNKMVETFRIDGAGEFKEVFDGQNYSATSNAIGNGVYKEGLRTKDVGLFAAIDEFSKFREIYPKITFLGKFDRKGKKVNLVEAVSKDNVKVDFVFDDISKFLVSRASGYTDTTYDDYRKVGDFFYPFKQTRSPIIKIEITEFKSNIEISDDIFKSKANCFDEEN